MDVTIETMSPLRVGAVRHVGPYAQIGAAFDRLGAIVRAAGLHPAGLIGVYHDDPRATPPDALRSDAAVVVGEQDALPAGLAEGRLPGGRYAKVVHVGPYERLNDVWARFVGEWFPASGHARGRGPSYERYLNTPETAPPHELRTELYVPLA